MLMSSSFSDAHVLVESMQQRRMNIRNVRGSWTQPRHIWKLEADFHYWVPRDRWDDRRRGDGPHGSSSQKKKEKKKCHRARWVSFCQRQQL